MCNLNLENLVSNQVYFSADENSLYNHIIHSMKLIKADGVSGH